MDPLSITASAITLVAAAGSIATTVNTFTRALRTADSRLSDLSTELSHLTTFLKAVQSSLKGHRAYDLSHFDDSLWQQSEIALSTCQTTLNELSLLVTEIRQGAGKAVLGRRARLAASLTSKAAELQGFRDRIAKSNLALQTILQTITVSLSLRNNVSQTLVLRGLDDLKASIDRAISRSWQNHNGAGSRLHEVVMHPHADAQLNRNLRDLAQAAKHFHSAASSTASSAANSARSDDGASNAPWQSYPGADMSLVGDFSDDLRERVEEYVREAPSALNVAESRKKRKTFSFPRSASPERALETMKEEEEEEEEEEESDDDDDAEFELAFVKGLQELICHHIRAGNYTKAIDFINEAMSNSAVASCKGLLRTLQSQLALSHLLQGQWRLASSLLTTTLARERKDRDAVVCSLLHGLAIAYLTEYAFDDALSVCRMALYGRRRLHKRGELEAIAVQETTALFATIYDMTGDYVRAEVLRGQLPNSYVYNHPENAIAFVLQEESLKDLLQGDIKSSEASTVSVVPGIFELPDRADNPAPGLMRRATTTSLISPLRSRICEHERLERDTTKEVVIVEATSPIDADNEPSPATDEESPTAAPLRRRLTQIFRANRQRRPTTAKPISEEEDEANDSGYGTSSPLETGSPSSPWRLRDFGPLRRAKTKKLMKKQPARQDKEDFRVLNMESKARVEAPKQSMTPTTQAPMVEDEIWKPRWNCPAQLAELHTTAKETDSEEESLLGHAEQTVPAGAAAPRDSHWTSDSTTVVGGPSSEDVPASTSSTETAIRASRPTRLQIPEPALSAKGPPLSIPSLDPLNLTQEALSPRLTDALSSLSKYFVGIPNLKTLDEMDGTRIHLCYILAELHTCGYDRTLEADVEAAIGRLWRRSARIKRRAEREEAKRMAESVREQNSVDEQPREKILGAPLTTEDEHEETALGSASSDECYSTSTTTTSAAASTPRTPASDYHTPISPPPPTEPPKQQHPDNEKRHGSASPPDVETELLDAEGKLAAASDVLKERTLRSRFSFERHAKEILEFRKSLHGEGPLQTEGRGRRDGVCSAT